MPERETGSMSVVTSPLHPIDPPVDGDLKNRTLDRRSRCLPSVPRIRIFHIEVPTPSISILKKVGAEFLGTFLIVFCGAAAPIVDKKFDGAMTLIGSAGTAGLAVMLAVFCTGHISAAHLNPSVTIALAALRYFPWIEVPAYLASQVCASLCAAFALKGIYHPFLSGGVTVPNTTLPQAFFLEFLITFILLFVITAVLTEARSVRGLGGLAIGGSVMLGILVAGPVTGASMNPARTLGPAVAAGNYKSIWLYFVAPTMGAIFGSAAYTFIKVEDDNTNILTEHQSKAIMTLCSRMKQISSQAPSPCACA